MTNGFVCAIVLSPLVIGPKHHASSCCSEEVQIHTYYARYKLSPTHLENRKYIHDVSLQF